ncbi:MAG: hypothetical protein M1828_003021 [Chrysothrix sp. TS-e1954]|nr:MAG: hypothetical protein M1828_003021 [Chrysothrix sp. TS-e1954]
MNATQSYAPPHSHHYMDPSHGHMGTAHGHATTSAPSYAPYPQPSAMMPVGAYPGYYGYGSHVSAPQPAHHAPPYAHHPMSLPTMPSSQPTASSHGGSSYPQRPPDETGQQAPPHHKPKLTGTVWEDEGTVCFQVEVNGICVARREDNCFINGTKLLNVANMTRGRRDGLLKSEKVRHVTKIGPMHLKGVWIPFDRALEFANKEKITEQLYPLFLHNIGPLVAPHFSQPTPNSRRSDDAGSPSLLRTPRAGQTSQPPPPPMQAQQSMTGAGAAQTHSSQSVPPQSSSTRPGLDRANTFPTPPTSATSGLGVSHAGTTYDWTSGAPSNSTLQLDTGMTAKSLPATPTTTPPDHTMPSMHYAPSQSYEPSRHTYSAPHQQNQYINNHGMGHAATYGQMQPPARANGDDKLETGDERDYMQGSYADQTAYGYADGSHVSDVKDSPHHPSSDRGTPRSVNSYQPQWSGYSQQRPLPSSSLSHVMGDSRNSNGYANVPSYSNHSTSSKKRGRDDDDDGSVHDAAAMKRRKQYQDTSAGLTNNMSSTRSTLIQHQ